MMFAGPEERQDSGPCEERPEDVLDAVKRMGLLSRDFSSSEDIGPESSAAVVSMSKQDARAEFTN